MQALCATELQIRYGKRSMKIRNDSSSNILTFDEMKPQLKNPWKSSSHQKLTLCTRQVLGIIDYASSLWQAVVKRIKSWRSNVRVTSSTLPTAGQLLQLVAALFLKNDIQFRSINKRSFEAWIPLPDWQIPSPTGLQMSQHARGWVS